MYYYVPRSHMNSCPKLDVVARTSDLSTWDPRHKDREFKASLNMEEQSRETKPGLFLESELMAQSPRWLKVWATEVQTSGLNINQHGRAKDLPGTVKF